MKLVNIGFGNVIHAERIIAVVSPDSAPIKRMVQEGKDRGTVIDASFGRKTRAVIVMDSDHIVLSYLTVETVSARIGGDEKNDRAEDSNVW
ncbi:MAG: DUF370 domain-containing protein [Clostridia bacterium]|nr:DUF370 domain-containing protein [Clostridia bacterium]